MISSPKIVAILAGGKSKRFAGQDKGEILIERQRLIDIICACLTPQSTEIIISGTHNYGLGLEYIPDAISAPGGPVGGLYSIWKALSDRDVEGFYTAAIDGPNLPHDLTDNLYSAASSTIAKDELGRHPTYGWWRMTDFARVFDEIDLSQSVSLNRMSDLMGAREVEWEGGEAFININCPADLSCFVKDT